MSNKVFQKLDKEERRKEWQFSLLELRSLISHELWEILLWKSELLIIISISMKLKWSNLFVSREIKDDTNKRWSWWQWKLRKWRFLQIYLTRSDLPLQNRLFNNPIHPKIIKEILQITTSLSLTNATWFHEAQVYADISIDPERKQIMLLFYN